MAGLTTERLEPAVGVRALEGQTREREKRPRERRPPQPAAPEKIEPVENSDEPPHKLDQLA